MRVWGARGDRASARRVPTRPVPGSRGTRPVATTGPSGHWWLPDTTTDQTRRRPRGRFPARHCRGSLPAGPHRCPSHRRTRSRFHGMVAAPGSNAPGVRTRVAGAPTPAERDETSGSLARRGSSLAITVRLRHATPVKQRFPGQRAAPVANELAADRPPEQRPAGVPVARVRYQSSESTSQLKGTARSTSGVARTRRSRQQPYCLGTVEERGKGAEE